LKIPKFLEKKSTTTYNLHIFAKPNSKLQKIISDEEKLIISLRSKPIQNKANKELIGLLKKKLKIPTNQIELVSGLKGTKKIVKLSFLEEIDEESIIKRLLN
jgi:uncharacterized protein YggU (UPF0235/DUF167 family)